MRHRALRDSCAPARDSCVRATAVAARDRRVRATAMAARDSCVRATAASARDRRVRATDAPLTRAWIAGVRAENHGRYATSTPVAQRSDDTFAIVQSDPLRL